jgi:hypothetical protein
LLGGGVGDSYQPVEANYRLARGALEILLERGRPVHVLTKSTAVLEDADRIRRIHERSAAIVSVSLSSVDERLSSLVEPGVPPPAERLAVIRRFRDLGVPTGVYLMPILPRISDGAEMLEAALEEAAAAGATFLCFAGLTLREGRQKQFYLQAVGEPFPEQAATVAELYPPSPWGQPSPAYGRELERRLFALSRGYQVPLRMPPELYSSLLEESDRILVALEHIDYLLRIRGRRSAFGRAAATLAAGREPDPGSAAAAVVAELRASGRSRLYQALLRPWRAG